MSMLKGLAKSKQCDSIRLNCFWVVLLFTITLVFSILYNLPASWLIAQPSLQKQIPKQWVMDSVQGTVWDGEMTISTNLNKNPGAVLNLGALQWDIDSIPLLKGILGSQQKWLLAEKSQVDFYIEKDLFTKEAPLLLYGLQGSVDIERLIHRLSAAGFNTLTAAGQVIANDVDVVLDSVTLWPQKVSGRFEIHALSTLGMNFPIVTAVPSMEAKTILLTLSAQDKGWQLKGRIGIRANHTYDITLSVKGDSAKKMPDWALLMVQKTPTLATLTSQGRW